MFNKMHEVLVDLPVAKEASRIALAILDGSVIILSAATGSGKTLYQTSLLAQEINEQVVVIVPRVFLARNAAETVAELSEMELGIEVGYAVGMQSGEQSCYSEDTKLLFVTYGYAIASGLINKAQNIVFDEVHEASTDISICRALIHRRLKKGEKIRLMEMSATLNAERQSTYWNGVARTEIFKVDGTTIPCEVRSGEFSLEDSVMDLVVEGRRGIAVFCAGIADVKETAEAIENKLSSEGVRATVSMIYGDMSSRERRAAVAAPRSGEIKVLVGTSVIESGMNVMWFDGGVSSGEGKLPVARDSGAVTLDLVDLPRWRLEQQKGRLTRLGNRADKVFGSAVFVLVSHTSWDNRQAETKPEIGRLPLTELVMHCARFGLRTEDLVFDHSLEKEAVKKAERKLQHLGLLSKKHKLTAAGRFVSGLPIGPETGAMLWHAKQTGVLSTFLPLAAVIEAGGIRKDFRQGHGQDSTSDYLDGLKAFEVISRRFRQVKQRGKLSKSQSSELFEYHNVGYKRYQSAKRIWGGLRRHFDEENLNDKVLDIVKLRRCIIAGSVDRLFKVEFRSAVPLGKTDQYNLDRSSALYGFREKFVTGYLNEITPRNGRPSFTVLKNATHVSLDDLVEVSKYHPNLIITSKRPARGFERTPFVQVRTIFGNEISVEECFEAPSVDELREIETQQLIKEGCVNRLRLVDEVRTSLGMQRIVFEDSSWRIGGVYSNSPKKNLYSVGSILLAEDLMRKISLISSDVLEISAEREQVKLPVARFDETGFRFGYSGKLYAYSVDGLTSARGDTDAAIPKQLKRLEENRKREVRLKREAEKRQTRMRSSRLNITPQLEDIPSPFAELGKLLDK